MRYAAENDGEGGVWGACSCRRCDRLSSVTTRFLARGDDDFENNKQLRYQGNQDSWSSALLFLLWNRGFGIKIGSWKCKVMYRSPSTQAPEKHCQEQLMNSGGLLRYRSAPTSLLGELCEDFLPVRSSYPETAADVAILDGFLAQDVQIGDDVPPGGGGKATGQRAPQFTAPDLPERSGALLFSPASQQMMMLHSQQNHQQQQQLARKMEQMNNGGGGGSASSNLVRHSSSPAGLFSHLNSDLGFPNRAQIQPSFSSRQTPIMSQIAEAVIAGSSSDESSGYMPGLPPFSFPPKPSPETAATENYLHFHDSVPCKLRAKRGCATHPRSIAERVRRTRISERIKKLQELVPNMDTQTNTADMLDLSISYIKDLQKQVQTLSESRSRCTCSSGNRAEEE